VLDHRDLVGERAVEADPAHRPRAPDRVAERLRRDLAVQIPGVEPVVAVGGLDHRHGGILGGRQRERPGERADEAHPGTILT
jgi:hypothetical protein